jgi:multicomponent Na+:H+ antiporter subunit F
MTPLLPAPVLAAAGALVGGAFLLALHRLVRGPTAADRVVALDLMAGLTVGAIGLQTLATGSQAFLRVATVLALVGFLGTVAFATYLARRTER